MRYDCETNPDGLPVIRTARTKNEINEGARNGFRPLVREVKPSPEIHRKISVYQSQSTGEVEVSHDYRFSPRGDFSKVIDWIRYYPHPFPSPFAAYLIPQDLQPGARVVVADVIEDIIEARWNQGDVMRLGSCVAIWDGADLKLCFDPAKDGLHHVG